MVTFLYNCYMKDLVVFKELFLPSRTALPNINVRGAIYVILHFLKHLHVDM